jgi:hypothetical protein
MALNCDPATLVALAKCFDCIPKSRRDVVELYLQALISNNLTGSSMDPATLVAQAKCFDCVPKSFRETLKMYLECQIAAASGA